MRIIVVVMLLRSCDYCCSISQEKMQQAVKLSTEQARSYVDEGLCDVRRHDGELNARVMRNASTAHDVG